MAVEERHAPDLRGLCAEVRALRAELDGHRELMNERDVRYMGSFKESKEAVSAALQAAKEQTTAAFTASEKAIVKAEDAQRAYNTSHNDLLRKQELLVPRIEVENRFKAVEDKIAEVRKADDALIRALDEKLGEIRKGQAGYEGRTGGADSTVDRIFQIVPLLIMAAALAISVYHR